MAAEDNAKTWKFVPHTATTFHVTFRYKLLDGDVSVGFLESCGTVEIVTSQPQMTVFYSKISLGTWKAQLKSAHGKSSQVFRLNYSGPNEDWLDGNAVGPNGEREEIQLDTRKGTSWPSP